MHATVRKVKVMSDWAQIMKEIGGVTGGSAGDHVKIEHILVISLSDQTDRLVRGIVAALQEIGRQAVQSLRIVAIGSAVGITLWGTARLLDAFRNNNNNDPTARSKTAN